jgi:hypothetical protein
MDNLVFAPSQEMLASLVMVHQLQLIEQLYQRWLTVEREWIEDGRIVWRFFHFVTPRGSAEIRVREELVHEDQTDYWEVRFIAVGQHLGLPPKEKFPLDFLREEVINGIVIKCLYVAICGCPVQPSL